MSDLISGWATCAVCDKPVDQMSSYYDHMKLVTVVTVKCHGETESAELSDRLLCSAGKITAAVAFRGNTLALRQVPALEAGKETA